MNITRRLLGGVFAIAKIGWRSIVPDFESVSYTHLRAHET